jgi:peptidoglycan glycosyltransferase
VIDTGAGLLLCLLVAATATTKLGARRRLLVYGACVLLALVGVEAIAGGSVPVFPERAAGRLAAWVDPWGTHHRAEVDNAGVRAIGGLRSLATVDSADQLSASEAAALIRQELTWRTDTADGEPITTVSVVPYSRIEELVLHQAELLWSDLGGYRLAGAVDGEVSSGGVAAEQGERRSAVTGNRTGADVEELAARVARTMSVIDAAVGDLPPGEESLGALSASPRPDGYQYQRSLYGLSAGGLFGTGLGAGRPESIPEVTEDLAIVFVGEAFGLVGVAVIVVLVMLLAVRAIERAGVAPGPRGEVVAGIGLLIGVQTIVNLGGVTGSIPLTGVPFPFISRTGTGALALAVGLAVILALTAGDRFPSPRRSPLRIRVGTATRERWVPLDPLVVASVILLFNAAVVHLVGRQLAPVGASVPRNDSGLLTASDPWALPDYRTAPGAIVDRNGHVLADNGGLGLRAYPDAELGASLSHSLTNLEWNLPLAEGEVGPTMVTTFDAEVQRAVHRAIDEVAAQSSLADSRTLRGAVVVIDVVTGELIAIESRPTFSPLELSDGALWARAEGADRRAGFYSRHLHRALDGQYPPGSVFKLITASATVDYGLHQLGNEDFDYRSGPLAPRPPDGVEYTTVWHQIDFGRGQTVSDRNLGALDDWVLDIEEALAYSSNVSFAIMANELGSERMAETIRAFGFDTEYTIPYYGSFSSSAGAADSGGIRFFERGPWELALTGIGQGETLVAPLHLALMSAALANDGVAMAPFVVSELRYPEGATESVGRPKPLFDTGLAPTTVDAMQTMMGAVVDYGTARLDPEPVARPGERMAGKTGSAQWSDDLDRTHALFSGFYPRSSPRLAIAVVVERGGAGADLPAAIARRVFESQAVAHYLASVGGQG